MDKYSMETSITISIIIGLILPYIGLGNIWSVVIVGFISTYLTKSEDTSYKVGAIAGGLLAFILFLYSFITPPPLPYRLPSPLTLGGLVVLDGFFTLILGLVMSLLIYGGLGALGGYIATKFFNPPQEQPPQEKGGPPKRRPRRTLQRSYE